MLRQAFGNDECGLGLGLLLVGYLMMAVGMPADAQTTPPPALVHNSPTLGIIDGTSATPAGWTPLITGSSSGFSANTPSAGLLQMIVNEPTGNTRFSSNTADLPISHTMETRFRVIDKGTDDGLFMAITRVDGGYNTEIRVHFDRIFVGANPPGSQNLHTGLALDDGQFHILRVGVDAGGVAHVWIDGIEATYNPPAYSFPGQNQAIIGDSSSTLDSCTVAFDYVHFNTAFQNDLEGPCFIHLQDDFDDEASADPPAGWTYTVDQGNPSVALETSATSSVRLSVANDLTTRIMSTGLPLIDLQSAESITLTVAIDAMSNSSINVQAGFVDDISFANSFNGVLLQLSGEVLRLACVRQGIGSNTGVGPVASLPALVGYGGGPVTITVVMSSGGYRVTADFGGYDSGFRAWSTYTNGFDLSALGASNVAYLQSSLAGSVDFDRIAVSTCPTGSPPIANAGADFSVDEGQSPVTLDGSGSSDPDSDPLTYAWLQLSGTPVTLSDDTAEQPTFDAPMVALGGETLDFELTVTANGESATDTVTVTVNNVDNAPPVVTITAPADGLVTNGLEVTVDADIADEDTTTVSSTPAGLSPETLPAGGGMVSGSLALDLEGINDLIVSATDASGNTAATAIVVVSDTVAPEITISPAEGTIVSSPIPSFGIAVTDQTNTDVSVGGSYVATAEVPGGEAYGIATIMLTGTIALWTEGANSIVVEATDAAGNTTTVTRTVILDSTAPLVEITSPDNGACYGIGSAVEIPLIATIDDATATEVTGALVGSLGAGGGTLTGTFTLAEGVNEISVSAQDNGGMGIIASDTITVTLDTSAPAVEITTPDDGACVRGSIEFGATATDALPGAVDSTTYFVDDVALPETELYVVDTTLLADGLHDLRVDATDSCGNVSSTSIVVLVDNTAPEVTLSNPLDLDWVAGTIGFDGSATDDGSGLAEITMLAAGSAPTTDGSQNYETPSASESVSSLVDTVIASGGLDGDLELEVTARDCAGNETTVAITVMVDNTAPVKAISSPADGSVVRCEMRVQATADDSNLASVQFVIDGVEYPVLTAPPFEVAFDTRTRLDGDMPITLIATDFAGNVTSCTINVTVDNLRVRIWPSRLQLKARGWCKSVTARVEGQSAGLLAGLDPQDITLCVPGGSPIPATLIYGYHAGWQCSCEDQSSHRGRRWGHRFRWHGPESRVRVKFDRRQLIGALRGAGLTSGRVEMTLKASSNGETFVIGKSKIRVKGR